MSRFSYLQRIFTAYLTGSKSHLTFWHGEPQLNENFEPGKLAEYYQCFFAKADYPGHYDKNGIPMLDYHGKVGLQYNPIAIAQYGLGNYNLYCRSKDEDRKSKFLKVADWLVQNLEASPQGTKVWNHHFDWEYRDKMKAPWYSALSQGQGLSLLVRAHKETGKDEYIEAAEAAFGTFKKDMSNGGVIHIDSNGFYWFEEAIVDPPTHILNGFIWATWGVLDFYLHTGDEYANLLYTKALSTLRENLHIFDVGFWSLYEQSGTYMKMLASPFYHRLHIVQLKVIYKLTHESIFIEYADRWTTYQNNRLKRSAALIYKSIFKLLYY